MGSEFVVVAGVGRKDAAQVGLAEDNNVIEAFPADRTDKSLRMPILPGRPRGDRMIPYTHGCKAVPAQKSKPPSKYILYHRHTVAAIIAVLSAVGSLLSLRLRSRASLELELVALRHQVTVLRRQRPGRPRLFSTDRLLWTWLYRIWPALGRQVSPSVPGTGISWEIAIARYVLHAAISRAVSCIAFTNFRSSCRVSSERSENGRSDLWLGLVLLRQMAHAS